MKKLLCVILSVLMISTLTVLASCGEEATTTAATTAATTEATTATTPDVPTPAGTLKFGVGVSITASATDAAEEKNGTGEVDSTVAVITVDADGKVVACKIDVAQIKASYTSEGEAVETADFRTKGEKGNDYGMSRTGKQEWYVQAAAFEGVVAGKTLNEIKALVAEGGKGTEAVTTAGCTIGVEEFVKAIEKAFANLADSSATSESTLKLGMATEQTLKDYDAESEKDGSNEVDTTVFAAAVDAEGKILAVDTDCVQVKFTFDGTGKSTFTATEVLSKRQKGDDYGMSRTGKLEWYAQADAFETVCLGKTAAEVVALMVEGGKGNEAVTTAGCTIGIEGFVQAAAKLVPAVR